MPRRRTQAAYESASTPPHSRIPPPDRTPLRQRLRRADDSYSAEEETEPEEDPEEEPKEEVPSTFESSRDAQIQGVDTDVDVPLGLGQRAAMLRAREEDLDVVPATFEIGQSSRGAHQEEINGEIWRDIECVVSAAPRVASPEYTPYSPSFVPPS